MLLHVTDVVCRILTGPVGELPVKVTGNIDAGFVAEFTPRDVGGHTITVEYNGQAVGGTPFLSKAYDARRVYVGPLPKGQVGKTLEFMGRNEFYFSIKFTIKKKNLHKEKLC